MEASISHQLFYNSQQFNSLSNEIQNISKCEEIISKEEQLYIFHGKEINGTKLNKSIDSIITFFKFYVKNNPELAWSSLKTLYSIKGFCHCFGQSNEIIQKLERGIKKIEKIQTRQFKVPSVNEKEQTPYNPIKKIRNVTALADIKIVCKDNEIEEGHSIILKENPYFAKLSNSNWKEKDGNISWDSFSKASVGIVLDYLYGIFQPSEKELENFLELYHVAHYIGCEDLKLELKKFFELNYACDKINLEELLKIYYLFETIDDTQYLKNIKTLMYNLFKKNKESYGDALIYYFSSQPESSSIYENLLLQRIYKLKDLSQSKIASIFKCIQPLAKDQSRAQALLGYFYLKGIGTKKNAAQAVELFKMASKHQEPLAQWGLGEAFEYGTGGITKDMKEAVKMYTLASKQNLVLAHYELAIQHENGEVIEKDLPLANYYYTLAANEEFPPSQNNLAYNFEYGIGLTSNKEKALELYTLSANQGYPAACYNLGLLKKSLEAFKLFKKAAMKGHVKAQLEVSEMYRKGEGVKKNKTKANKFLALANSSK